MVVIIFLLFFILFLNFFNKKTEHKLNNSFFNKLQFSNLIVRNCIFIYRKMLLSLCFVFYKNTNIAIFINLSENIKTDKTFYKHFLDYKELLDYDTYCKYVVLETPLPSFLIDEFQTSLILLIYSGIFFYKSTEYLLYLLDIALDFETCSDSDNDMFSESNKKILLKIEKTLKKF